MAKIQSFLRQIAHPLTGDVRDYDALVRLAGRARFPTVQKEVLAQLAREQHPFATILGLQ